MDYLTEDDVLKRLEQGWKERAALLTPNPERKALAKEIIAQIEEAFEGVELGDGIGLREGEALGGVGDAEYLERERRKDERWNWKSLSNKHLNRYEEALHYFDPAGMRFHLPAFLICDLSGEFTMYPEFYLTNLRKKRKEPFSLFSTAQKQAVAQYLQFIAQEIDRSDESDAIYQALEDFWLKTAD